MLRLWHADEFAARLRTSTNAIYQRQHKGEEPLGAMIAGRLTWRADDVERYLAARWAEAPAGPSDVRGWVDGVPLLTMGEAARRIQRTERTLRHLRLTGQAPRAVVLGGRLLFRQDDVDAWLAHALGPRYAEAAASA